MTINEIKSLDTMFINPLDAAEVLRCNPQAIRMAARMMPEKLGFPTVVIKNRVRIPRVPFLRFMGVDV